MKLLLFFQTLLVTVFCNAGTDISCKGTVTQVLADHSGCSGKEFVAFRMTNTNGNWICTTSTSGVSVILAASLSGREIQATIDTDTGTQDCQNIISYSPVDYIILKK